MDARFELDEPLAKYVSRTLVKVAPSETVSDAVKKMKAEGVDSALVVLGGKPAGIITERDVLYKVVATGEDPTKLPVSRVMSSPVETIEDTAKTGDAIARMSKLDVRRLVVTHGGETIGVITQKSMVTGRLEGQVSLPELTRPKGVQCPYCGEVLKDSEQLSKHIDQTHIGKGLLQGDVSKW